MLNKKIMLSYAIQIIMSFCSLVMGLLAFFDQIFLNVTFLLVAVTFLIIGFNYYTLKDERRMSYLYFVLAFILIILNIFRVI
jgi:hypothetical protein